MRPPRGVALRTNAAGRGSGPHCPQAAGPRLRSRRFLSGRTRRSPPGPIVWRRHGRRHGERGRAPGRPLRRHAAPLGTRGHRAHGLRRGRGAAPGAAAMIDPMVVQERVRATGLLAPGSPVTVLLSGGRDSVCLLDVALHLAGRDAVSALHVDYGVRDSAAEDEAHCAELCARLAVPLEVRHPGAPDAGNLQAWAPDQRYASAAQVVLRRGGVAATGHTATDQVETVLYRLAASPGRRALLGMPARSGRLARPLLGITRAETAAYCPAHGLAWREDPTNRTDAFARNRI